MTGRARPERDAEGARARELGEDHVEALTVAMIVAPGVYARNRMFDLFARAGARRARTRAALVRGIVPHLARATAVTVSVEARGRTRVFVLRYAIASVRLTRVVELSAAELAALRLMAERASVRCLPAGGADREVVAAALSCLLEGDVPASEVRLAHEAAARRLDERPR